MLVAACSGEASIQSLNSTASTASSLRAMLDFSIVGKLEALRQKHEEWKQRRSDFKRSFAEKRAQVVDRRCVIDVSLARVVCTVSRVPGHTARAVSASLTCVRLRAFASFRSKFSARVAEREDTWDRSLRSDASPSASAARSVSPQRHMLTTYSHDAARTRSHSAGHRGRRRREYAYEREVWQYAVGMSALGSYEGEGDSGSRRRSGDDAEDGRRHERRGRRGDTGGRRSAEGVDDGPRRQRLQRAWDSDDEPTHGHSIDGGSVDAQAWRHSRARRDGDDDDDDATRDVDSGVGGMWEYGTITTGLAYGSLQSAPTSLASTLDDGVTTTEASAAARYSPAIGAVSASAYVVLCCAVLCCAVLCCAVLCCAVLCCAVLCCAAPVASVLCLAPLSHRVFHRHCRSHDCR